MPTRRLRAYIALEMEYSEKTKDGKEFLIQGIL